MQAGGQPELGAVLPRDGLVETVGGHEAEDRAEVLDLMELAAGLYADTDARAPQAGIEPLGLQQPLLARLQLSQAPQELLAGRLGERPHLGRGRRRPRDA